MVSTRQELSAGGGDGGHSAWRWCTVTPSPPAPLSDSAQPMPLWKKKQPTLLPASVPSVPSRAGAAQSRVPTN